MVQPLWKTVQKFLKKLRIELPYDPAIPLLGIYPKKTKTLILKKYMHPTVRAALFIIAKIHTHTHTHSHTHTHTHSHTHTIEYYSAVKKRMKFCHLQQHGWT